MATLRTGTYGAYYGTNYISSMALTEIEMTLNASYIYNFFHAKGWTNKAIASILGNMTTESSLNPGRWQSDNVGNYYGGYGLVQWTPATNYTNNAYLGNNYSGDPSEMDSQLNYILYELENNLQWITTDDYPISFKEFTQSNKSITYLTTAFLKNYERAGVENLDHRIEWSEKWYEFILTGNYPDNPGSGGSDVPTLTKKKGFKFILFNRRRKIF